MKNGRDLSGVSLNLLFCEFLAGHINEFRFEADGHCVSLIRETKYDGSSCLTAAFDEVPAFSSWVKKHAKVKSGADNNHDGNQTGGKPPYTMVFQEAIYKIFQNCTDRNKDSLKAATLDLMNYVAMSTGLIRGKKSADPLTPAKIADVIGKPVSTTYKILKRLCELRILIKKGKAYYMNRAYILRGEAEKQYGFSPSELAEEAHDELIRQRRGMIERSDGACQKN